MTHTVGHTVDTVDAGDIVDSVDAVDAVDVVDIVHAVNNNEMLWLWLGMTQVITSQQ